MMPSEIRRRAPGSRLELEARFASRLGEGAHAPVVEVTVAIEDDAIDLLRLADLRDERADLLRCVELLVVLEGAAEILRQRRRMGERLARRVVDDLCVDVPRAAKHAEARAHGCPVHLLADAELAAL